MGSESSSMSSLIAHAKMVGYYAGVAFGVGYILVFAGIIAITAELLANIPADEWSIILATVPGWVIATLVCYLIAVILGIVFGASIISNSRSIRDKGVHLSTVTSSVSIFSFMIIFAAIGSIVMITGSVSMSYYFFGGSSLVYPILNIVGAILLLIGFRTYQGKQVESKIIGGIMMLISIVLIYIIALRPVVDIYTGLFGGLSSVWSLTAVPGPLLAQSTLETVTLLLAAIGAIVLASLTVEERLRNWMGGVILSVSGILFSIGLLYFNFSAVSRFGNLLSSAVTVRALWVLFFGFLVLGIAGIIAIVAACFVLAISARELSARPAQSTARSQPPSP